MLVDYWIIVSGLGTNDPEFFILTPDEVGQRCFTDSKGEPWLQRNPKDESKGYARPQFREAWERIGQAQAMTYQLMINLNTARSISHHPTNICSGKRHP